MSARHRWEHKDGGQRCKTCGVFRYMFFPIGGPRARWVYEKNDDMDVREDDESVPPCPGGPTKKETT